MISVINYTTYQNMKGKHEPQVNRKRTASEPQVNPIEERNKSIRQEGNKGNTLWPDGHDGNGTAADGSETALAIRKATSKARPTYPESFEAFWLAYPTRDGRKRGKDKTYAIWCREVVEEDRNDVVIAAQAYSRSGEVRRGYARDPERFLAKRWWCDFLNEPESVVDDPRGTIAAAQDFLSEQRGEHG